MATIQAIYQEIAGSAPEREAVARIGRAGRLLNLTDTDSGWLLLAVLAAHGDLAHAELQTAATLAASLSVATDEAKTTTEAVGRAASTAAAVIAKATDDTKPALTGAVDSAARHAATRLETIYKNLGQTIETVGKETGDTLATRVGSATKATETAIATATGNATGKLRSTVDSALDQALDTIRISSANLRNAAEDAREATIDNWRAAVITTVDAELSTRARIDTEAARRRTIWAAALASSLVAALIVSVGFEANRIGRQDGMQYGIGETLTKFHDQKARASWANTPVGKLAYQLYQAGSIHVLATCNQPGWKIEMQKLGSVCLPVAIKGSTYGWYLKLK